MILGRVLKSLDLTELFVSSVYVGLVNLFRNHRLRRRAGHCRMAHSVDPEIRRVLTKGERLVERQYGGGALSCTSALPPFAALVYTSLFRRLSACSRWASMLVYAFIFYWEWTDRIMAFFVINRTIFPLRRWMTAPTLSCEGWISHHRDVPVWSPSW